VIQIFRRQKAIQRLLIKELEEEKLEEKKKGNQTIGKDTRSCKQGTQHLHNNKLETPSASASASCSVL